jgi:DNA-binding NarL/FixJ family response regulator
MKNISIFIVERNPVWGNLLKYRLSTARFTNTRLLHSPQEALHLIADHVVPHYLITDAGDASINCMDFLTRVRTHNPYIKVIFFTTVADSELANDLLAAGATDYIARTGKQDAGIPELIKNLTYLCREEYQYR